MICAVGIPVDATVCLADHTLLLFIPYKESPVPLMKRILSLTTVTKWKSDNVPDSEVLSKVRDTVVEKEGGSKLSVNKVLLDSSTIWVEIYLGT